MPSIPKKPERPSYRSRRSKVLEELDEAVKMLQNGKSAKVDEWNIVELDTTKSVTTARAMLGRLRKESKDYPFKGKGAIRVYLTTTGKVALAVRQDKLKG